MVTKRLFSIFTFPLLNLPMQNTCIIIVGPTAVGKTALAIRVAQHFGTEIVSCDSRQCFKELNIGIAKPSPEELLTVQHHFINSHSIHETVNAAVFETYALETLEQIFTSNTVAVMVGGTGLYVKAFCDGMDDVPQVDAAVRANIIQQYSNTGIGWLQEQIKQQDPLYFSNGEMQNPQRMMRALEVILSSGRSIIEFQTKQKKQRPFNIVKIGLELPKLELVERIHQRVDMMMEEGLLEEVRSLIAFQHLNALQTVGYRELFAFLNDELTLPQAIERIKINTRQYAKRQMTWFKKDPAIQWCRPDLEQVLSILTC